MTNWRNNEACSAALAKAWDGGQGVCVFTSTEVRDLLDAAVAASGSPPSPTGDAQRLNWLEGTGESYCNRDRIDRCGAEWLSFDSEAALDANDPTGTHKNIRDAIDAAAGSAAVPTEDRPHE